MKAVTRRLLRKKEIDIIRLSLSQSGRAVTLATVCARLVTQRQTTHRLLYSRASSLQLAASQLRGLGAARGLSAVAAQHSYCSGRHAALKSSVIIRSHRLLPATRRDDRRDGGDDGASKR